MMTAAVLSAGDGYKYYTESIATGDVQRTPGTELTDYYTVDGNPPGVWIGGGISLLGVSGQVSEAQMRALFGEGLHPDADAITARMVDGGATEKEIAEAIKLGRAYYRYDAKDSTLATRVAHERVEFERINGRAPDRDELRQIRMREGAIVFRDVHNRAPVDQAELGKYVVNALKPAQHAVSGVDLTFSAPKSFSLLWALSDPSNARELEKIHEDAIEDTIRYLQEEALATRAGVNGVRQIDVKGGLVATRFRHHESRTGDVQLHDHVVVANKVQGVDGKWRSLDSKLLLRMKVAASEYYTMRLFDRADAAGYEARERVMVAGKLPQPELAGISDELITLHSTRSQSIKTATDTLITQYLAEHGRSPSQAARIKLSAQAWQQTRPVKAKPRSVTALRADVRTKTLTKHRAADIGSIVTWAKTLSPVRQATQRAKPPIDAHEAARQIMSNVETARSTWGEHHVRAEVARWVSAHRYRRFTRTDAGQTRPMDRQELQRFLLRTALQLDSIRVTPEHLHGKFQPLTRASDGESFYVSKGRTLYTSTRILEAETRLLQAAQTTVTGPAAVTSEQFAAALAKHPNTDAAQVRLAREFVTNRTQLLLGVGPAGAGKTRSMRLAAAAVQEAGGRMIGLAPSKQAAGVFAKDVAVEAFTIDAFLTAHHHARLDGTEPHAKYQIRAGDVVVIDEGAMAGTPQLDQVSTILATVGAYSRPLGDHAQLAAPGAGGAFRLIAGEVGAVELETIYRFTNPDEAAASKTLRESTTSVDPFAWYKANGRIIAAPRDQIVEVIFTDYLTDLGTGRASIMGAPTREYVNDLNARAQAHHISTGTVRGHNSVALNDGQHAHIGDRVMTRLNQPRLTMNQGRDAVANGDLYTVTDVHRDGSLTVTHDRHHGTIRLPAAYVRDHTHLGYAFTAHQEQGDTIGGKNDAGVHVEGVSRGIVTATTARANAYVLATRGTDLNVLYVEVEPGQHPDDVLKNIAVNVDTNLAAHEMIDVESIRMLELKRLVDEHADVVVQANAKRFEHLATRVLGPDQATTLTKSVGWEAIAAGLARVERHGLSPDTILETVWNAREYGTADDVGLVTSYRIENKLDELETKGAIEPVNPGLDTGLFEWAVDRHTAASDDLPEAWRDHLTERATDIDDRMMLRGAALVIERPEWTQQLGDVPADPERHQQWMRLAAEVELFRDTYGIPPEEPTAIPERFRDAPLGSNLAERVTALHKSTALRAAHGDTATADPRRQLQKVTELAGKIEGRRPQADAERAARTFNPDRRTAMAKQIAAMQARVDATAAKTAAAAERQRKNLTPDEPSYDPTVHTAGRTIRGPRL